VPQCRTLKASVWPFFITPNSHGQHQALSINPNFAIAKSNMAIALTDYGTFIKNQGKRVVRNLFLLSFDFGLLSFQVGKLSKG